MAYTDQKLGKNARRATAGPIGHLKGKPTDKMKTTGRDAITGLTQGGGKVKGGKK
jgi:hypothetical protein